VIQIYNYSINSPKARIITTEIIAINSIVMFPYTPLLRF